jgi:hypothetical protein
MFKLLPQQIPSVSVTSFDNAASAKVLDRARNRRIFGIVNRGTTVMEVRLNEAGNGDPIFLKAASTLTAADGGSLEFNGYNGYVYAKGTGYVYHFSEEV